MKKNKISVLVVEDDPSARKYIAQAIDLLPDMQLLPPAASLADARGTLLASWPEVLLIDLGLPDGDGSELIREISKDARQCEIMVITVFGDEQHVLRAIEAGASGYLLKEEDSEQIGKCIRQLMAGGSPMSASIARHLLNRVKQNDAAKTEQEPPTDKQAEQPPDLTKREAEVLHLIAKGYNFHEISNLLSVTYHTVTSHVRNIYKKLAVHSRSEAVFEAVQRGMFQLGA